jgi:hypothetical protein
MSTPRARLRHHVTGAIERGEAVAIENIPPIDRFSVRKPQAMHMASGNLAWAGDLYAFGNRVARFSNAGNGGCLDWYWDSFAAKRDFEVLAAHMRPGDPEAADALAGRLWDSAIRQQE